MHTMYTLMQMADRKTIQKSYKFTPRDYALITNAAQLVNRDVTSFITHYSKEAAMQIINSKVANNNE